MLSVLFCGAGAAMSQLAETGGLLLRTTSSQLIAQPAAPAWAVDVK